MGTELDQSDDILTRKAVILRLLRLPRHWEFVIWARTLLDATRIVRTMCQEQTIRSCCFPLSDIPVL